MSDHNQVRNAIGVRGRLRVPLSRDDNGQAVVNAFALTLGHGAGWDDRRGTREQDGWTEHADFMNQLVADGFILHGGPVGDGSRTLHLVEADDEDAVRERMARDPWAGTSHLVIESIEPWDLWLDHRRRAQTSR